MSKDWRAILRFAILGLAIAGIFFAFLESRSLLESSIAEWVLGAALILCPGFIPFVWAMGVEMGTPGFVVMWLIVGLINCVVYAFIGAAYLRFQKWRRGTTAT